MASPALAKLPKVHVVRDFLDTETHARILAESIAKEADYKPSSVAHYDHGEIVQRGVNPSNRVARSRALSPEMGDVFRRSINGRQDEIEQATTTAFPSKSGLEIEAVHSGNDAFFKPHIDTIWGGNSVYRVISAVYYYARQPRGFQGGELRFYSLDRKSSFLVEPSDNAMVFFSSIVPHEVLPVSVPSGAFADGRFSVNCWINRAS